MCQQRGRRGREEEEINTQMGEKGTAGGLGEYLHRVHTSLDEYTATFKEGAETPTGLSGHSQRETRLLAPFNV